MNPITSLYKMHGNEPVIATAGMAILCGVTESEFRAEMSRQSAGASSTPDRFVLPEPWIKHGRRIARETMAALGSDSIWDVIDYLALQNEMS